MTSVELRAYEAKLQAGGHQVGKYLVQIYSELSFPLVDVVMALVAIPFALASPRCGGRAMGIGVAIVIAVRYWMVPSIARALAQADLLPPALAADRQHRLRRHRRRPLRQCADVGLARLRALRPRLAGSTSPRSRGASGWEERRRWLAGVATALGAFALLAVEIPWIIPHFRHEPYAHLRRYAQLGESLGQIVLTVVTHPFRTLRGLLTGGRLVYVVALLAPLGFLPLRARRRRRATRSRRERAEQRSRPLQLSRPVSRVSPAPPLSGRHRGIRAAHRAARVAVARLPPGDGVRGEPRARVPSGQRPGRGPMVARRGARPISVLVTAFPSGIDRAEYVLVNEAAYP
jgi:lipopolysaccharide export system permease LptF/LptG-like protein/predicted membrane protein DUF2079